MPILYIALSGKKKPTAGMAIACLGADAFPLAIRIAALPPNNKSLQGKQKMHVTRTLQNAALTALCTFWALPAQAATVVADFNEIPMTASATTSLGPNGYTVNLIPGYTYVENGFKFTTDWGLPNLYAMQIGAITSTNPYWWTGSQGLFHSYGGSAQYSNTFIVTRVGGGVFDFISMDVAAFSNGSRYFAVNGYRGNSLVPVAQKYVPLLDDSYNTLETLTFGNDFKDLTMVTFSAWGQ